MDVFNSSVIDIFALNFGTYFTKITIQNKFSVIKFVNNNLLNC